MLKSINILYAISCIDFFAVGLFFPLFLPHLKSLGASHVAIGAFGSAYSGLQFISGPLIGSWSDIRGHKLVFILTLLVCSLCYFLIGLTSSLNFIFLLRLILGFVKHTQVLCRTLVGDLVAKNRQTEAYGRLSSIALIGFIIGPIIGGYLSESINGFQYICTLVSILFVINAFLISLLPNSTHINNDANPNISIFNLQILRKEFYKAAKDLTSIDWKNYWDVFILRILYGLGISIYFSNQPLYLQNKYALPQKYVGYTMSFLSIIGSITGFLLSSLKNKFYPDDINCSKQLLHSFFLLSISFLGVYFSSSLTFYVLLLVFIGIASIVLRIVTMEVMIGCSEGDKRGSLSGASSSLMSIARFVSPITSGVINDFLGENVTLLFAAIPSIVATILCFQMTQKPKVKIVKIS